MNKQTVKTIILCLIGIVCISIGCIKPGYKLYLRYHQPTLPVFHSLIQLNQSPWSHYLEKIYITKPQMKNLPINFNSFNMLYQNKLQRVGINIDREMLPFPLCPHKPHQIYQDMSISWDPANTLWIAKQTPFQAAPHNSWIEVTHSADGSYARYLSNGNWMYITKGSGIFFYTGKTIAFQDHPQAVKYFLHQQCTSFHRRTKHDCYNQLRALFSKAKQQGYDSIQFLAHNDQRCGLSAVEIVDLKGNSNVSCGDQNPNSQSYLKRYRTGFNHELGCLCQHDTNNPYHGSLNCRLNQS